MTTALDTTGITGKAASQLAEGTRQSAGTNITQLRAQGDAGPPVNQTATAVNALTAGFADAPRWALIIATVFLAFGLIGSRRLRRAAQASRS